MLLLPFDDLVGMNRSLFIDADIYALARETDTVLKDDFAINPCVDQSDAVPPTVNPNSNGNGIPPLQSLQTSHCVDPQNTSGGVLADLFEKYDSMHAGALQEGREHDPFGDAMARKFERLYVNVPRENARRSEDKRTKSSKIGAYCFVNEKMVSLCFLVS